jgi:hypothetical protein
VLDFAILDIDTPNQAGKYIGDVTGWFGVWQGLARYNLAKYTTGYPSEGFFRQNCTLGSCYPRYCYSTYTYDYVFAGTGDWHEVGWGCVHNGGNSGSGVFSYYQGQWWLVSVTSSGGLLYNSANGACPWEQRSTCSWYMNNAWGPELKVGWFDQLYQYALAH